MFAVLCSPDYFMELENAASSLEEQITYKSIGKDIDIMIELNKIQTLAIRYLIIDITAISNTNKIVSALRKYRIINDRAKIIILAPNALPGNELMHHLVTKIQVDSILAPRGNTIEEMNISLSLIEAINEPASFKKTVKWIIDSSFESEADHENESNVQEKGLKSQKNKALIDRQPGTVTIVKDKIVGTIVISVAGSMKRAGVTHTAISIGRYLKDNGFKVGIIELNDCKDFEHIKSEYTDLKQKRNAFILDKVDYYPYSEGLEVTDILDMEDYNYLVLDMGDYSSCDLQEFKRADKRIIVSGTKEWEIPSIKNITSSDDAIYKNHYIFTLSDKKRFEFIKKNMDELKCYQMHVNLDPFSYSKENSEIFNEILKDVMPQTKQAASKNIGLKGLMSKFKK